MCYQDLAALEAAVRAANPALAEFEASCFDGRYVTGDVTSDYLHRLAGERHAGRGEPVRDDDTVGTAT